MKASFLMFFLIVICIYIIGNVYLFVRGWQALEIIGRQRVWFAGLFWILALSFIVTQILRVKGASGIVFDLFFVAGSFWIAVMLYGFISLLSIDIMRIIARIGNIKPEFVYHNYPLAKAVLFGVVCLVLTLILYIGHGNASRFKVTRLEVSIDKQAGHLTELRVAMVSDIHLGQITGRKFLSRVVDVLNEQQADIVLLVGDTFDGAPDPVIKTDAGVEFERLKSKYGTYVVSGNHEYIGGRENPDAVNTAFDYLASRGVTSLQDAVVLIDSAFYVAGRKDRQAGQRKTIPDLLAEMDSRLPVILLDHQPYNLEKAEHAGVDLQLSGHTHHGQMWPLNLITRKIYEQDWGYLQKGKSHFYVSCGVGTWGPPIRMASRSEVVVIDLKFNK